MARKYPLAPGKTNEHYTPPDLFRALGCTFDLDVASPVDRTFVCVPSRAFLTPVEDGLTSPWHGFVWMNAPFGGRNGIVPWLERFFAHGNGIALVNALTSARWFHEYAPMSDAMLFPKGKTKFVQIDGTVAKSPQGGVCLFALGAQGVAALKRAQNNGYGLVVRPGGAAG